MVEVDADGERGANGFGPQKASAVLGGEVRNEGGGAVGGNACDGTGFADCGSGRALKLRSGVDTTYATQEQGYVYDAAGNLGVRQDARAGLTESFSYDLIDRLIAHTV